MYSQGERTTGAICYPNEKNTHTKQKPVSIFFSWKNVKTNPHGHPSFLSPLSAAKKQASKNGKDRSAEEYPPPLPKRKRQASNEQGEVKTGATLTLLVGQSRFAEKILGITVRYMYQVQKCAALKGLTRHTHLTASEVGWDRGERKYNHMPKQKRKHTHTRTKKHDPRTNQRR